MCLRAAEEVTAERGISTETAAVVGAAGNIGKAYSTCLAPRVRNLILIVRRPHSRRSQRLLAQLSEAYPATNIELASSMNHLQRCQLIIGASNSPVPVIYPEHLGTHPTVICDVALPSDVCGGIVLARPNAHIIRGGIVRLPFNDDLTLSGLNLPAGRVFACIAETLLMGLAGIHTHGSYGEISGGQVEQLLQLADNKLATAALLTTLVSLLSMTRLGIDEDPQNILRSVSERQHRSDEIHRRFGSERDAIVILITADKPLGNERMLRLGRFTMRIAELKGSSLVARCLLAC
jgi:hypothetical protein